MSEEKDFQDIHFSQSHKPSENQWGQMYNDDPGLGHFVAFCVVPVLFILVWEERLAEMHYSFVNYSQLKKLLSCFGSCAYPSLVMYTCMRHMSALFFYFSWIQCVRPILKSLKLVADVKINKHTPMLSWEPMAVGCI